MDAAISTPELGATQTPASSSRRIRTPVVPATVADHSAIDFFLAEAFDRPHSAEFKAAVEAPGYQPHDRLLLRRGSRLLGHVQLTARAMQFGAQSLPLAGLRDLCVATGLRGQGFGMYLLTTAERQLAERGAVACWLKTSQPRFFRRAGYVDVARQSVVQATTRAVLSQLLDRGVELRRQRHWHIRPWRQWELDALARIYRQNLHGRFGWLHRGESYWQWLVKQEAFDQIHVALEGPEQLELGERSTRIVGYAVTRGRRIIEILASPDRPRAAFDLVARICSEAIEQDRGAIEAVVPEEHPLQSVFRDAGGSQRPADVEAGQVGMIRLIDPHHALTRLEGEFARRAERAGLACPVELALQVGGRRYQIQSPGTAARSPAHRATRNQLRLGDEDFTRLVFGQLDWDAAVRSGRIEPSSPRAEQLGRALLPALPLFRPPWDDMMA